MICSIQSYLVLSLGNLNIEDFLVASSHYCRRHFFLVITRLCYMESMNFITKKSMLILNIIVNFTRYKSHWDIVLILRFNTIEKKLKCPLWFTESKEVITLYFLGFQFILKETAVMYLSLLVSKTKPTLVAH